MEWVRDPLPFLAVGTSYPSLGNPGSRRGDVSSPDSPTRVIGGLCPPSLPTGPPRPTPASSLFRSGLRVLRRWGSPRVVVVSVVLSLSLGRVRDYTRLPPRPYDSSGRPSGSGRGSGVRREDRRGSRSVKREVGSGDTEVGRRNSGRDAGGW